MSGKLILANNKLIAEANGHVVFDTTQRGLFNLVPSGKLELTSYAIDFPDLQYAIAYFYAQTVINQPPLGEAQYWGSHSWTLLYPGEYGPSGEAEFYIPDIVVGTVPVGTNYLDVRGRLSETIAPSQTLVTPLAPTFPQGDWFQPQGGSLLVRRDVGVRRLIEFHLSGTNVILRRRVSVKNYGSFGYGILSTNISTYNRWTTGLPSGDPGNYGPLGTNIDSRGFSRSASDTTYRRGGSNGSSLDAVGKGITYACRYAGDIVITPGRIQS